MAGRPETREEEEDFMTLPTDFDEAVVEEGSGFELVVVVVVKGYVGTSGNALVNADLKDGKKEDERTQREVGTHKQVQSRPTAYLQRRGDGFRRVIHPLRRRQFGRFLLLLSSF